MSSFRTKWSINNVKYQGSEGGESVAGWGCISYYQNHYRRVIPLRSFLLIYLEVPEVLCYAVLPLTYLRETHPLGYLLGWVNSFLTGSWFARACCWHGLFLEWFNEKLNSLSLKGNKFTPRSGIHWSCSSGKQHCIVTSIAVCHHSDCLLLRKIFVKYCQASVE